MAELESFKEHFEELRKRLFRIVLVIGVITTALLTVHLEPVTYMGLDLYYPTLDPLNNIAAQLTTHMKTSLVPPDVQLIQTAPGQAFFAQVYIAALVGLIAGMPIVIKELVSFIRPALKENEIHISRSITVPAFGLFITGALFSYFVVIPYILDFLYKYGESAGLVTFLNVIDFVAFVLQFLLAFGLSFQLPLVMYAITASSIVDSQFWRKNIRYAIVVIVIFGAVVTPDGSGVTMWFISCPMIALYLAGMVITQRSQRKSKTLKS